METVKMKQPRYSPEMQASLLSSLNALYGEVATTAQIEQYCKNNSLPYPSWLINEKHKVAWGRYRVKPLSLRDVMNEVNVDETVAHAVTVELTDTPEVRSRDNLIPQIEPSYVPFGFFSDVKGIIESKIFYPVYVTGLSGNGKTYMIDQACAAAARELIRVNITKETDENDLIGSYELIDGNTVWRDGPVLIAMKRGAILLLDETDYGSERLLCLQPVLEGKGYFNKKKGEYIEPAFGFNIMATANTKGKGSDDGRFIGANVLNEAFLERFAITVEQDYPSEQTERKILEKLFVELHGIETRAGRPGLTPGMEYLKFAANLSKWAELIRKSHADGAVDEIISTRRLGHICRAYMIFRNKRKAIELCLNRFDREVKTVYLDFYGKIDQYIDAKVVDPAPGFEAEQLANKHGFTTAAPVNPTAPAAVKSTPVSTPATAPIAAPAPAPVTNGTNKVVFGDARNIASVGIKYKTKVTVTFDKANATATVVSHGMHTVLSASHYTNATIDVLDATVANHARQMGAPSLQS